jgi:hypothetical protein
MAFTNTTPQLGLPQWEPLDKPQRLDFNAAFSRIEEAMAEKQPRESLAQLQVQISELHDELAQLNIACSIDFAGNEKTLTFAPNELAYWLGYDNGAMDGVVDPNSGRVSA